MPNNRFQTVLTTGLAMGLGGMTVLTFLPQSAVGFPTTPAVSLGSNPVEAWAGTVSSSPVTLFTAPGDQNIVITDIHLSCNYTCETRVDLIRSDGATVGSFWVSGGYGTDRDSLSIQQQFASGIPILAGQTVTVQTTGSTVAYTLSGYQARP